MLTPIKTLILATVLILTIIGCSSSTQEQSADASNIVSETSKKPTAEDRNLAQVVDQYLLLKDALVASNSEETQAKATKMLEVIDATNMMGVQQSAKQIATTEDLDTQRTYFDSLRYQYTSCWKAKVKAIRPSTSSTAPWRLITEGRTG